MKKLILIYIYLMCCQAIAYNCVQFEAQIIAGAEIVFDRPDDSCQAKINDIRRFNTHIFCPITLEDARNSFVSLDPDQCDNLKEDQEISGYLVMVKGDSIFSLED